MTKSLKESACQVHPTTNIMQLGATLIIFFLYRVLGNEPGKAIEQSSVNVTCRDDSVWNTTLRRCIECNPGFVGRNCSILCHYPQYGYLCSKRCENCSNGTCDHRTGCPESESTLLPATMRQTHRKTFKGMTKQKRKHDVMTISLKESGSGTDILSFR
ncbi:uncharacterized protein LOC134228387 [Saccostrea cucullata]|uniref:uncharacterized protein LOC134228387 n=1 Tax=Saccostrea cuccullata TaxID=36930 RepID=UPI002ED4432C